MWPEGLRRVSWFGRTLETIFVDPTKVDCSLVEGAFDRGERCERKSLIGDDKRPEAPDWETCTSWSPYAYNDANSASPQNEFVENLVTLLQQVRRKGGDAPQRGSVLSGRLLE